MRRALALAALAACGSDAGPTDPVTATVTHYDYTFDVDSRLAHAAVTATVETAGNCLSLPFRADAFDPTTATVDGAPAIGGSTLAGTTLTLCGPGHEAGDAMTVEADLTIPNLTLSTSQVGYSITQDSEGNPFYYLVSWVNGCDQFGPCDSRPSQFATYHFDVTHPANLMVRCPGDITETSATETECNFDHPGGPTYSTFGVAAYPAWTQTDMGSWGGVHVTVYDRASTGIAAAIDPTWHGGFVAWMQSEFGPYPFGSELRVLTAPTYWSGFEHPGNIVLDDSLAHVQRPAYADDVQHTLDHEMTHMWAGDQTTLADTYDFVWKESMAEYLAYVYEDMKSPTVSIVTSGAWKSFAQTAKYFPVPGDKPALFDYYGDVYGPGPMVLFRQLEVLSSRDAVLAALKTVLGQPRALSVDELVAALQTSTGIDLAQYAAAWIHGSGAPAWPKVALAFTPGTPNGQLAVHVVDGATRLCKFHVALTGANPGESASVEVDTFHDGPDQMIDVPMPAFAVTATILDPDHECLVFPGAAASTTRSHPWRSERFLGPE
jgi:aminopeptidase N